MYIYNDFERLFLCYKLEVIPSGVLIEKFCMSNKVPYNLFSQWYLVGERLYLFLRFNYLS